MPLEIVTVACLVDNYSYLLHSDETGETALVDAPEAEPILSELEARNWQLSEIWLTHHHWDHIDGARDVQEATGAMIIGAADDAHRLPPLNHKLSEAKPYSFAEHNVRIIDVPGHTVGHIAFYVADASAVFTGDSLMAFGCGRLFEGTPDQMWKSLNKLADLPANTLIYSGHEYTQTNAEFALTIEYDNPTLIKRASAVNDVRGKNLPTVPSILSDELATNPFLRAGQRGIKSALKMEDANNVAAFAEIRRRKDVF